jgi:predicted DNA-binding transcriptional regulator YafY
MTTLAPRQIERLFRAALCWKRQGKRDRWATEASLALWDTVDDLERLQRGEPLTYNTADIKVSLSQEVIENCVLEAKEDNKRLWMHYVDRHGELTERLVKPISMTSYGFDAFCFSRQEGRYFKFTKIVECRVVDRRDHEPS